MRLFKDKSNGYQPHPVVHNALRGSTMSMVKFVLSDGRRKGMRGKSGPNREAKRVSTHMMRKHAKQECAVALHEYEEDIRLDIEEDKALMSWLEADRLREERDAYNDYLERDLFDDRDDYNDRSYGPEYDDFDLYMDSEYDEVA